MFKSKYKSSYGFKIMFWVFLLIVTFLFFFSVYIFGIQRKQGYEIMKNYNNNIISSVEQNFSVINDSVVNSLFRISGTPYTTRLIYQENDNMSQHVMDLNDIKNELQMIPKFDSAVIYNHKVERFEFQSCIATDVGRIIDNILNSGTQIYSYSPNITMKKSSARSDEPVITYYAYEYLDKNTMNGVIAMNINLEWIAASVSSIGIDDINIRLCDKSGMVLYDYSNVNQCGQSLGETYTNKIIENVGEDGFGAVVDGKRKFVSVSNMPHTNYLLICEQPYDSVYTGYMKQIWINLTIMAIIILLLGFGCALVLSRYISAPINRLTKHILKHNGEDVADSDIFNIISDILERSANNTIQMIEMKKSFDASREENNLIRLMCDGNRGKIADDDYNDICNFFEGEDIVGIELLFENHVVVDKARKICNFILEDYTQYKFVTIEYNKFILLLKDHRGAADSFGVLADSLKMRLEVEFDQSISIFISSKYTFDKLDALYEEISHIREYELVYGHGCILDMKMIEENYSDGDNTYPKMEETKLLKAIIDKNSEETEVLFDNFLAKIMVMRVNDFKTAILRLALSIQSLFENDYTCAKDKYKRIVSLVKSVAGLETLNEVCTCFAELLDISCNMESENVTTEYNQNVQSMIKYIDDNFENPALNQEMIAGELGLSSNYVGKQFKAAMGISVSKYLTEYRLKKSITYLNETELDIRTIMDKVGFANESNFYRQFKKYYGITPKEYRTTF